MMLKNYDESVEININPDCSYLPDHPFRMLVIDSSRSSKTNMLLNLIKYLRPDVDKIYIYIYICQRSIRMKVSIDYHRKRNSTD